MLVALRGGCEKREAVTCDTAFVTPPNWDVSNCVACKGYAPAIADIWGREGGWVHQALSKLKKIVEYLQYEASRRMSYQFL